MIKRIGLISPITSAWMDGYQDSIDLSPFKNFVPEVEIRPFVYNCLIQSGFDKIYTVSQESTEISSSPILRKRTENIDPQNWVNAFFMIQEMLGSHIPKYNENESVRTKFSPVSGFLVDIIFSLSERKPLIHAHLAGLEDCVKNLPPQIQVPVRNLLSSFEHVSMTSPMVADSIDYDVAARFQEVMTSELYRSYVRAQSALEKNDETATLRTHEITKIAISMCERYDRLLKKRALVAHLLPFSTKFVSTVFGKFPGGISEVLTSLADKWSKENQRLVVYNLNTTVNSVHESRLSYIFQNMDR